jgi:tetratricopeptide (TPR) repeat protein
VVARRGTSNAQKAAELFEQVIKTDPAFAPAYAGLADAYAFMSMDIEGRPDRPGVTAPAPMISSDTALSRMRPAAVKAIELDPLLAEAHAAMGLLRSRERNWENAQASFQRAIDLNPSLTRTYTNYVTSTLIPLGRVDEAARLLEEALRADPLSLDVRRELAMVQIIAGRYEEAIANLQRVRAVDPGFPFGDLFLARALTFAGRLAEALPLWETMKDRPGGQWIAYAYVMAGRRAEVERMAAAPDHPYRLAIIYAALGDKDRALVALDQAADTLPQRVGLLLMYPEMAPLRGDPRFAAVRRKLGLP